MTTKKTKEGDEKFARLNQQEIVQNNNAGFLFCPRCSHVDRDGSPNSICPVCQYRFCPSCSD